MPDATPRVVHQYRNWTIDSTRWESFTPREGDVVIATPYKAGTTWMQLIVGSLVLGGNSIHDHLTQRPLSHFSPWIDLPVGKISDVIASLDTQDHRRFVKTHLPLDGVPYFPEVRYIVVSRDPRDVFMSLWNHHTNYTPQVIEAFSVPPAGTLPDFWRDWTTRGAFPWESEGYPYWSNLRHVQTWWDYRGLPNVLFVHFNHLLTRLSEAIERVASYLGIPLNPVRRDRIAEDVTFATIREKADSSFGGMKGMFVDGARTFFHKGTNGRWASALSGADLALYDQAAMREMTDECRAWLELAEYPEG